MRDKYENNVLIMKMTLIKGHNGNNIYDRTLNWFVQIRK
jgi:hypothetical protein